LLVIIDPAGTRVPVVSSAVVAAPDLTWIAGKGVPGSALSMSAEIPAVPSISPRIAAPAPPHSRTSGIPLRI